MQKHMPVSVTSRHPSAELPELGIQGALALVANKNALIS
jgi:hypothetical protein